jgi:cold shock CspA family protein
MRKHGTLTRWNDDRGFGFIKPSGDATDVFVHISAFPRDGRRPQLNELISFEVEAGSDGRSRAVRIMRPGQPKPAPAQPMRERRAGWLSRSVVALGLAAAGVYGYSHFSRTGPTATAPADLPAYEEPRDAAPPKFSCDGRTRCPEMRSCEEATFFIRNCPNTQMDGDGDGIPCETQWC